MNFGNVSFITTGISVSFYTLVATIVQFKMAALKSIALITTSTRTPRIGPKIASIVHEIITKNENAKDTSVTPVNVADFNLPVYDEEVIPSMVPSKASFAKSHSIAWSAEIAKYDGYILIIPEYNYGLAGGTKNAIDYLYHEWIGKSAAIISYGIKGGTLASAQLDQTLKGMKVEVAATRPSLTFHDGVAPDLFLAMGSGQLGEDTKKDILAEAPTILKAFDELKQLIDAKEST